MFHRDPEALARAYLDDPDPGEGPRPAPGQPPDLLALPRAVADDLAPVDGAERLRRDPRAAPTPCSTATTRCRSFCSTTCRSRRCCCATCVTGRPWIRVDVNIGKLVEPAGD